MWIKRRFHYISLLDVELVLGSIQFVICSSLNGEGWCIILNLMCQIRKVNNSSRTETWSTNKQLNHASSSMVLAWYFNTILYHNTLLLNNNIHNNIYYPIIFSNQIVYKLSQLHSNKRYLFVWLIFYFLFNNLYSDKSRGSPCMLIVVFEDYW